MGSSREAIMSSILSSKDCEEILMKSVQPPATLITYTLGKSSDKVMGFLGDHFRLIIKYQQNNTDVKTISYFLKTLPKFNENQTRYVIEMGIFKKECLVYDNLLRDFSKLTKQQFAPLLYHIKPNECIILEDLSSKGFKNLNNPYNYLNLKQITLVLQTVARLHACSVIYEEKKGGNYRIGDHFQREMEEVTFSFVEGHPRQKWCVSTTKCLEDVIKLVPGVENVQDICEKLNKFVFGQVPKLLKPSKQFRNVLSHNDLWCNNLMFKANDCILVDFQLVRYTPPAFDILLTLYVNLEKQILDKNISKLINVYYETFSEELEKHDLNPIILLSKDQLIESLESYRNISILESCMYGTNVYISNELSDSVMADMDNFIQFTFINRSKFIVKEFQENPYFRIRFMNVLMLLIKKLETELF